MFKMFKCDEDTKCEDGTDEPSICGNFAFVTRIFFDGSFSCTLK